MEKETDSTRRMRIARPAGTGYSKAALIAGLGLGAFASWMLARQFYRARRYADHAADRRQPMSLFTPGPYPRRRKIDRSGGHPLFERRQSVYSQY